MPMWPYKDFDACVIDQKSKWSSEESAKKICWAIKAKVEASEELAQNLSEDTKVSPQLAKKIIDALTKRWLEIEMMNSVIWEIKEKICEEAMLEKLNKSTPEEIDKAIDDMMDNRWEYSEKESKEVISEIILSEWVFDENAEYEILTTAKQTNHRYGDFEYSKADLETMAKNFNDNIVGTEIPVDLNHDPEHIAYAWIKPWSMVVKESSNLEWQYSLYAQLYRFTPEGKDIVSNGKIRYFSLQIQNVFTKFIDKKKKTFNLVIRALALTNMPVIKDMAPTLSEGQNILFSNPNQHMEKELAELEAQHQAVLSEKDKKLADTEAENKRLADELEKANQEKRDKFLADEVEKLCLSDDKTIAFKGGEKEKILAFVKTLSEEQAKAYFELHTNIITSVDLDEHWDAEEAVPADASNATKVVDEKAKALAQKENIPYSTAVTRVLSENPELASKAY